MFRTSLAAGAAAGALLAAGQAGAAVTFVSSLVEARAYAEVLAHVPPPTNEVSDGQEHFAFDESTTFRDLTATANVDLPLVIDGVSYASAAGDFTSSATFTDPSAGVLAAVGVSHNEVFQPDTYALTQFGAYSLNYSFSVDRASHINLDWVNADNIFLNGPGGLLFSLPSFAGDGSGSFNLATPGVYGLVLYGSNHTTARQDGIGTLDATVGTQVTFAIAGGVPEPATWALMIAGFGATGAALRRRRAAALA